MPCHNSSCTSCCPTNLPCGCPPQQTCTPTTTTTTVVTTTCECNHVPGTLYRLPPRQEVEVEPPRRVTVTCACNHACNCNH